MWKGWIDMKILSVECSASPVSCAIVENGRVKGRYYLNMNMTHSQTLMPMLQSLMKLTGDKPDSFDLFAVSAGPGSFTGVRIGIAAIKGLAFCDDKPCAPVSPLEAMAYNFLANDAVVIGCMDARCNQVYNGIFKVENGQVVRLVEDRALTIPELIEELKNTPSDTKRILAGDGAHLVFKAAEEAELKNICLAPENLRFQDAVGVANVGQVMYNNEKCVTANGLLPIYLRLPQAERELKAKSEGENK